MSTAYDARWQRWAKRQGALIRAARTARNLNTIEMAKLSGVDKTTLIRLERGDYGPLLYSMLLIARALELPLEALVEPLGK